MSESFKCIYFFENQHVFIAEVRRMDLAENADKSDLYRWLLVDRETQNITALTFLSMDSSGLLQERFFKQGYLSFDSSKAVFIPGSGAFRHILDVKSPDDFSDISEAAIRSAFD